MTDDILIHLMLVIFLLFVMDILMILWLSKIEKRLGTNKECWKNQNLLNNEHLEMMRILGENHGELYYRFLQISEVPESRLHVHERRDTASDRGSQGDE